MNDVTVLQASQGLAKYVKDTVPNALERGVILGHDHRHNSARFVELAALAFSIMGFKVYMFGLVHTPMVPFGVDTLGASCGVMVTASHNPAKDNGYKVYWENGCQIIPPHDAGIAKSIEDNLDIWSWDTSRIVLDTEAVQSVKTEYFKAVSTKLLFGAKLDDTSFRCVYTPMHGVGRPAFKEVCRLLGLSDDQVVVVPEQAHPDPDFPTVKFPNPEEKGALDLAIKTADAHGISLILSNDPDADRFVAAVKNDGKWTQLTGNQIGSLFADYITAKMDLKSQSVAVVNSTVSSQLNEHLGNLRGFKCLNTLTGFKWIGNGAIRLEKEGNVVPFGYEEALGYMFSHVHDKDGIAAAFVFVQMANEWAREGTNGLQRMDQLYKEAGYYAECNSYYIVPEPAVTDKVFERVRSLAKPYPTNIGQFTVNAWRDLTIGYDSTNPPSFEPILPITPDDQMIQVEASTGQAGEGVRFTARGSGTEPKLKVYIEGRGASHEQAQKLAQAMWNALRDEWFQPATFGLTEA